MVMRKRLTKKEAGKDWIETRGVNKEVDMSDPEVRNQVKIFGSLLATQGEMAGLLNVTRRTIETYMSEKDKAFFRVYDKAAGKAKTSLRRVQMQKALEGDNTLLIWLGKQVLGQKDKHETETTSRNFIISADVMTEDAWEQINQ